jgi:HEAT repeat protein
MRIAGILSLSILIAAVAAGQGVRVSGAPGTTLQELVNTPTLVTVVLKGSGATDANLRIIDVQPAYFTFLTEDGDRGSYRNDAVEEVRIQGGQVEKSKLQLPQGATLRAEDLKIIDRVKGRIRELYDGASENQELKIRAAALLAVNGEIDAREYLQQLVEVNEIKTQLAAALALYVVGGEINDKVIRAGLEHGNRAVRAQAATLAGLLGYRAAIPTLNTMLQDRAAELSSPAARALARLGVRDAIPKFLEMLTTLNEERAAAAVDALTRLGGEDVIEQLKLLLSQTDGQARYRVVQTLYNLGDPLGRKELTATFNDQPTIRPEAALLLAKAGDWKGQQYLRERLGRRENPTDANLAFRAQNVAALLQGGDPSVVSVFQELLREGSIEVKKKVFDQIAEIGDRNLLTILQSSVESTDPETALGACNAALSIALPDYRQRTADIKS